MEQYSSETTIIESIANHGDTEPSFMKVKKFSSEKQP